MEMYCRSELLAILEDLVSDIEFRPEIRELESGSLFKRWKLSWRWFRCPILVASTAGSDFRRGGPRWSSGASSLNCHGKITCMYIQIFLVFSMPIPNLWAYFCLGLSHFKATALPSQFIFLLHPLVEKNMFNIELWQLKPMHLDSIFLSFSYTHPNSACTPCFAKGLLFYLFCLLFVLLIR